MYGAAVGLSIPTIIASGQEPHPGTSTQQPGPGAPRECDWAMFSFADSPATELEVIEAPRSACAARGLTPSLAAGIPLDTLPARARVAARTGRTRAGRPGMTGTRWGWARAIRPLGSCRVVPRRRAAHYRVQMALVMA